MLLFPQEFENERILLSIRTKENSQNESSELLILSNSYPFTMMSGKFGALDIFRGTMVNENINLYTVFIALALSNGKEKRKSWPCLCSPRSNGSKAMG